MAKLIEFEDIKVVQIQILSTKQKSFILGVN